MMAPSWTTILNVVSAGPLKPSNSPARIMWPVEETGRNSVIPSMIPRMMTLISEFWSKPAPKRPGRCDSEYPAPWRGGRAPATGKACNFS